MNKIVLTSKKTGRKKSYIMLEVDRKKDLIKIVSPTDHHLYLCLSLDDIIITDKD